MSRRATCDWCEADAVYITAKDGAACVDHKRDLITVAAHRIARSGNPFAGEAAEALIGASAVEVRS